MFEKTTFIPKKDFEIQLLNIVDEMEQLLVKADLVLNENLYPLKKDSYHFVGQALRKINIKENEKLKKALYQTLFRCVYQAEVISAGSGYLTLIIAMRLLSLLIRSALTHKNDSDLNRSFEIAVEQLKNIIEKESNIATKKHLKNAIKNTCNNKALAKVIWEAVSLGGYESKIYINNGKKEHYSIELKEGYSFKLNAFKFMIPETGWKRKNCKVIIVDGMIEKVSEIDQILTKAFETKQPIAIIAFGFSEEIVATLLANMKRDILDIMPLRIPTDLENINTSNDISVVCGTTPISAMKGDMITFLKYEDIPEVDSILVNESECSIENVKTRTSVSKHIKSLLEKRQEQNLYEDLQLLIDKRMKSLISNAVNIYLPNLPPIESDTQRVLIDIALRQCKTILNYGTVDFEQSLKSFKVESEADVILRNTLQQLIQEKKIYNCKNMPTLGVVISCLLAVKTAVLLSTSSGFVSTV